MSRRRLSHRTLKQAETAAKSVERPRLEVRSRLRDLTDDQRQRVALFLLASLAADHRFRVLARHLPAVLPVDLDEETTAAAVVWISDVLLDTQHPNAQRLRLLRHDIP